MSRLLVTAVLLLAANLTSARKPLPPFATTIAEALPAAPAAARLRIDVLTFPAHGHYLTIRDLAIVSWDR